MDELVKFALEYSIANSAAIFLPAIVVANVGGMFFQNLGFKKFGRAVVYSLVGAGFGLWSYSVFDIPNRDIESTEAVVVYISMFIYALIVIGAVVFLRIEKTKK